MTTVSNVRTYWWLFIIWPFMAIILALRAKSLTPNLIWAFIVFYGLTFVISVDNQDSDITRYIAVFQNMHERELSTTEFISSLYKVGKGEDGSTDILQSTISYVVSLFTDSTSALLVAFAFVFGFFYSRNVWMVLAQLNGTVRVFTAFFFLVFLLIVPVWNINGFRFWTATHIFFYGTFNFIFFNRRAGIVIAISSILAHFSFLIPVLILFIYVLLGKRLWIYFSVFVASIFINNFEVNTFNKLAERYIPAVFMERADSYTSEQALERFQQRDVSKKSWYAVFYKKALAWSMSIIIIILFIRYRRFIQTADSLKGFLSFTLLLFGVANLLATVPSGIRFVIIASMFACAAIVILVHYNWSDSWMKRTIAFTFPLLALFVVVSVREGFNTIGINTLFSNAFIASLAENKVALIDIFKWRF